MSICIEIEEIYAGLCSVNMLKNVDITLDIPTLRHC